MDKNDKMILTKMKIPKLTSSNVGVAIAFFMIGYTAGSSGQISIPTTDAIVVRRVIDGDTVELSDGKKLRYIGINTPEITGKSDCFGEEAKIFNTRVVEGKEIRLEQDISETDRYGRLLRYVWVGDQMINEVLVREGFAQAASYPPDVKYNERFLEAQRLAKEENKGLWGGCPAPTGKNTIGE